jgi:hypothetical protein
MSDFYYPLIHRFLNKRVRVKVEGLSVEGKLLRYQENNKDKPHMPQLLILQNGGGIHILRGDWINISEVIAKK